MLWLFWMWIAVLLFVVFVALAAWFRNRPVDVDDVYREVKHRTETPDGEDMILECGHGLHVTIHRQRKFRCDICTDQAKREADGQ